MARQFGSAALLPAVFAAIALGLPALVVGQDKPKDESKVSNDDPSRPFQLPPALPEVKEALDDFDRFGRRGAWERALKSLYSIPDTQAARFIDGENGFVIPVASRRRTILATLPAAGMAAYKTFYDTDAKKLFEEADGPNQLADLERVYTSYFSTSVGDNAADRLGDLYFELGRFDRAADCWLTILRDRPDTDLSLALVSLKAALALHRAGRAGELDQVRADLKAKHDDESVTMGGRSGKPTEVLRQLIGEDAPGDGKAMGTAAASADPGPELGGQVERAWQVRFADSVEAGQTPLEHTQWDSNSLSMAVPAITSGGSTLFVNYLGFALALDAKTGKMLWRSGSFHMIDVLAMQQAAMMIDSARFAVVAADDFAWFVTRDIKDQNMMAPYRLACRRASSGDVVWKTDDLGDYTGFDLFGAPLLVDGKLFIIAKSLPNPQQQENLPKQWVLAIRPDDGKILWKSEVGTFRQAQQMYYYYYQRDSSPQPRLILQSGSIYVDTNIGVLARLDADSGSLEWGFGYKTDPVAGQGNMFFFYPMPQAEATTASAPPLKLDDALLVKGAQSDQIQAVDPNRMKVLWERPISKSSRVLGTDGRLLFLGGPELSALDLKTKELLWASRIPGGSLDSRALVRPDGIWQLTPRGVFEVDPKSGNVRRIFRGDDLGAVGGDLYLTDRWLISVSNRTISAYPRRAGATNQRASNE